MAQVQARKAAKTHAWSARGSARGGARGPEAATCKAFKGWVRPMKARCEFRVSGLGFRGLLKGKVKGLCSGFAVYVVSG